MKDSGRIEQDRVALFEAWGFFRARLRQQRGGRLRAVQQSLLPMLTEILLEVKEGFASSVLEAVVSFGRVTVRVKKMGGGEFVIAGQGGIDAEG